MSLHTEVDAFVSIMETHNMIDNVEAMVLEKYRILTSIHMDPINTKDTTANGLREKVKVLVKEIDLAYTIHDCPTHTNLVFDILLAENDNRRHSLLKKEVA